jgi:uncharacterized membrane protein
MHQGPLNGQDGNGQNGNGQNDETYSAIRRNIEAVAKLEENFVKNRSLADKLADWIGGFSGSVTFVLLHVVVYGLWILINLKLIPGARVFDPYPFLLLSVVVSIEAIFLSTFVLMKQNRMSRRADQRNHLDLQINLLAEREMTTVLQLLGRISARLGVPVSGGNIEDLSAETSVAELARQISETLPEE